MIGCGPRAVECLARVREKAKSIPDAMPDKIDKDVAHEARLEQGKSLRHRERDHVRKVMAAEAREKCHETRDAYLDCARGRTFSLPFMCRSDFQAFNKCLSQYTSEEEFDRRMREYVTPEGPKGGHILLAASEK